MTSVFFTLAIVVATLSIIGWPYYKPLLPLSATSPEAPAMIQRSVIVVGGGLAGLSATIEAFSGGAHVTLIEKEARLGGNSAKASSGMNGVGTVAQTLSHSGDTPEYFKKDTLSSGGGACNETLVELLVRNSASAIEFLTSFGVDLSELSKCGGHSYPRTHRAKPPPPDQLARNIGFEITSKLIDHVNNLAKETTSRGSIRVINSAKATKLLTSSGGDVVGVESESAEGKTELRSDVVILTTGGYAADRTGLLEKYVPHLAKLSTTNGPWALGEGVRLAEAVGAKLVLMDQVQVHPTGFVDPKDPTNPTRFLAPEALRAVGGILVDKEGRRFVDELSLRNAATAAIFAHGFKVGENGPVSAYMILTEEAVQKFGIAALKFYKGKGFIVQYANAKEVSAATGINEEQLRSTIEKYNAAKQTGGPDEFGKTTFPVSFNADSELNVLIITPSIHYTMGGAAINTRAQVLRESGDVIKGLYAAGEVSGGVHGNNRLAGNSLLECVVFGRIAGQQATTHYVRSLARKVQDSSYNSLSGTKTP